MKEQEGLGLFAPNGDKINKELMDLMFDSSNTYVDLPNIIELVAFDVTRSEFDSIKEHSILYHLSGLSNVISSIKKALKTLEDECKILDIDIESEMDMDEFKKYSQIKEALSKLNFVD